MMLRMDVTDPLGYNKIDQKQNFKTLDMVKSRNKKMWSLS